MMTAKLKCVYCKWETPPYDMWVGGGYLEAFELAKGHIKKHHKFAQERYGLAGQAIQECFKVITV